jgi:hypothetical protein
MSGIITLYNLIEINDIPKLAAHQLVQQTISEHSDYLKTIRIEALMSQSTDSFQSRELSVTGSFFFCEVCNSVCEYGDEIWKEHQNALKFHKMKRMLLLRCSVCKNVVIDAYAAYSPERNQFWCKNCIGKVGYLRFRSND